MMFHVKLSLRSVTFAGIMLLFLCITSCIGSRPATQITDYLILENGIENQFGKALSAFVFENKTKGITIETFLNQKLKPPQYEIRKFVVQLNGANFNLTLYENSEIDKYFATTNLVVMNLDPVTTESVSSRKFIAISVTDASGNDCLSITSLFYNIVINYLKSLKDEYYQYGR